MPVHNICFKRKIVHKYVRNCGALGCILWVKAWNQSLGGDWTVMQKRNGSNCDGGQPLAAVQMLSLHKTSGMVLHGTMLLWIATSMEVTAWE